MPELTAQQFATKYAGQVVKLSKLYSSDRHCIPQPSGTIVGIVVGWSPLKGDVAVAGDVDKFYPGFNAGWTSHCKMVVNKYFKQDYFYYLPVNCIEPVIEKPISVYPHYCRKCGLPSRNSKNLVVCSNGKCKVNKLAFKKIKYKRNKNHHVICELCQNIEVMTDSFLGENSYLMRCCKPLCEATFIHAFEDNDYFIGPYYKYVFNNEYQMRFKVHKK